MRLYQLNEKVNDDIKILSEIADLVLSWLPKEIPSNEVVRLERLSSNNTLITTLMKKYPNTYHSLILALLSKTYYIFNNTEQHMNVSEVGVHVSDKRTNISTIVINLSALFGSYEKISKDSIITSHVDNKPFKTIKSVLIHEMRHGQQYVNYGGHPKSDNYTYDMNPDEIDAAWLHHLSDYNVNEYNSAIDYVRDVMKSFDVYKTLSDRQKKQYLSKTAVYWDQHHNPTLDDTHTLKDRMKHISGEKLDKLLKDVYDTANIDGVNDLRNYEGYPSDATSFLLPYENFLTVTKNALVDDNNNYTEKMIAYVYGFLSMMNARFGIEVSFAGKILTKKYSMTPEKATELIKAEGFGKFDSSFFINIIEKTFK